MRRCGSFGGLLDELSLQLGLKMLPNTAREQRMYHVAHQLASHDYLLLIDDLDAINDGRTAAIHFLRQLQGPVIVTARLHPLGLDQPMRVAPLTEPEVFLLCDTLGLGLAHDRLRRTFHRLEGSPLLVRLLGPLLRESYPGTELIDALDRLPTRPLTGNPAFAQSRVQALSRLAYLAFRALPADSQPIALAAALVAPRFDAALLAAMLQTSPEELVIALPTLAARGLIERATQDGASWWMHSGVSETLSSLVPDAPGYHQRAAAALAQRGPRDQLAVAAHLRLGGQSRAAARWLIWKMPEIIAAGGVGALMEELGVFAPAHLGTALWREVNEARGDLARQSGDFAEATRHYQQALLQVRTSKPPRASQQVSTRLARKLAEAAIEVGALEQATPWLERADQTLPEEDSFEEVSILLARSKATEQAGDLKTALGAAQAALDRARLLRRPHRGLLRASAWRLADVRLALADTTGAVVNYEAALALAVEEGAVADQAELRLRLGEAERLRGHWLDALEHFEQAIALWSEICLEPKLAETYLNAGTLLIAQGRYPQALNYLRDAERLARWVGLKPLGLLASVRQAEIRLAQGDFVGVLKLLNEQHIAALEGGWPSILAEIALLQAEVARRGGDEEQAKEAATEAERWAQRGEDEVLRLRAHALLALLTKDGGEIETALSALDAANQWLPAARLRLEYASTLAARQPHKARRFLQAARQILHLLGARPEIVLATELATQLKSTE
jgi:tetratricopeptide (TPR) repeat protein